ncbi:MAG: class I SAM-dependent methyltransferase, partial [Flavobacteriales bacterium]
MIEYNSEPYNTFRINENISIHSFISEEENNIDKKTVESFGEEWEKFTEFDDREIESTGSQYFDIINESELNDNTVALDLGCGSGRWTRYISKRVKFVEAIDPSNAVIHASKLHKDLKNVRWTHAGVDTMPFRDNSFDFILCLGVLHHIPDTKDALQQAVKKLRSGGIILLYLYYALDNRGVLYKSLFHLSTFFRKIISNLPGTAKRIICDLIAVFVYMPFVTLSRILKNFNLKTYK